MKRKLPLLLIFSSLCLVMAFLHTLQLQAETITTTTIIYVNNPLDGVDAQPGDGICERTPGSGDCTLRAAIQETNALPGPDTIILLPLPYPLAIDIVNEDESAGGDLDITDDVTIAGGGWYNTFIYGNSLDRIFHILGPNEPVVHISDLTVWYGTTRRLDVGFFDVGGGLYNQSGHVTLDNVHITNNFAGDDGGAIYNNAWLTIQNGVLGDNISVGDGGGIANSSTGVLTITNSLIEANEGADYGGGISTFGTLTMTYSTVHDNVADTGGGIQNRGRFFISHSTIVSNNAATGTLGGGGVFNQNYSQLAVIADSTIVSNTSALFGGGISNYIGNVNIQSSSISHNEADEGAGLYLNNAGMVTVTDSLISHNQITYQFGRGAGIMARGAVWLENNTIANNVSNGWGGGIYARGQGIVLLNSTLSGNVANRGGAIYLYQTTIAITNTTIAENQANSGGGLFDDQGLIATATLQNSIVANNAGGNCVTGTPLAESSDIISAGFNLDSGSSCGFNNTGDLNNTDPLLGLLDYYGGDTPTHSLLPGSPVIDAGSPTDCPATDQRGVVRPLDGNGDNDPICDMGSYEYEGGLPLIAVADVSLLEGDSGQTAAAFTLTLSITSTEIITVNYMTMDGSAVANSDYVPISGLIQFLPGETMQIASVLVNGDLEAEADESFYLILTNPINAVLLNGTGTGTILNDDYAIPGITISDSDIVEGNDGTATAVFTVTLTKVALQNVVVSYETFDGTAQSGTDYLGTADTILFLPSQLTQNITITVYGDIEVEPDETFMVKLSNPTVGYIVDDTGIGTILNDDGEVSGSTVYLPLMLKP